jgi:hypothetical protein
MNATIGRRAGIKMADCGPPKANTPALAPAFHDAFPIFSDVFSAVVCFLCIFSLDAVLNGLGGCLADVVSYLSQRAVSSLQAWMVDQYAPDISLGEPL